MAIARQESARNPKAQSPVGASGLMQVMPRTAQHTVQMFNIPGYVGPSQLFDPQTNITIGTSYLESVYQQFGRNRILSTAAYNAGPSRVNTAGQQRRADRSGGVHRKHSVLGNPRLRQERAGL